MKQKERPRCHQDRLYLPIRLGVVKGDQDGMGGRRRPGLRNDPENALFALYRVLTHQDASQVVIHTAGLYEPLRAFLCCPILFSALSCLLFVVKPTFSAFT